jgi:WNK lysine deficient protein kinase
VTRQEVKALGHEIEILKSVRHPNIITFHEAWYNESEFVFITELMTSGTLREYIRKLNLPNIKIVKRWCRQILKGLVYLHSHQPTIIHRDIKCDNIFINGAHGEIKIGDMGTAEMKIDKKYTVIGTPEFMAPEMYEEKGYSEKVDIYAFGMCLLEMVTGEYPYNECTNAAQVFKKVTQNIRPECLSRVQDPEVLSLINNCLAPENERMSAQEMLEHSFLAVEPEVVLLASDMGMKQLTLQVAFKGMDKLSVKFEFNADTDTAEDVVAEMIEEQVLPERYQQLITGDINRLLRDLTKQQTADKVEDDRTVWRRENDIRSELERAKRELRAARDKILDAEKKCDSLEQRTQLAEERYRETISALEQVKLSASNDSLSLPDADMVDQENEDGLAAAFESAGKEMERKEGVLY